MLSNQWDISPAPFLGFSYFDCLLWSVEGMLYLVLIVVVHQIRALRVSPVIQFSFWLDSIFSLFSMLLVSQLRNHFLIQCHAVFIMFSSKTILIGGSYIEGLFPFSSMFYIWHLVKVRTHSFIYKYWSWAGNQNCSEFMSTTGLLCPKSILPSSKHMTITIFLSPLSRHHLWGLPQSHSPHWLVMSLCVNHHLLQ